jgi:uncharacterized OB-fold protein
MGLETSGPRPSPYLKWRGSIPLEYRYTAGVAGQRFLSSLKERGRIICSRCRRCGERRVPPRLYCIKCYSEITDYEDLEGEWTVVSFAVERVRPEAIVYGLLRFQGVEGGLVHRLIGVEPERVRVGMKVVPVMRETRTGSILDIEGFRPVSPDRQHPSG